MTSTPILEKLLVALGLAVDNEGYRNMLRLTGHGVEFEFCSDAIDQAMRESGHSLRYTPPIIKGCWLVIAACLQCGDSPDQARGYMRAGLRSGLVVGEQTARAWAQLRCTGRVDRDCLHRFAAGEP